MKLRKNVYELTDKTLYWYSVAVKAMKDRDINDPTSWWYQAGVHGYSVEQGVVEFWQEATGYPPSKATVESEYWNRCQHGTWYFLPWHRMYLHFFEQTVAKTIVDLGGPADWTLPYWNYCDAMNENASTAKRQQALQIPPQFGSESGSNPEYPDLWIEGRRHYTLLEQNINPWPALQEKQFSSVGDNLNFGGGITGFSHFSGKAGQLEHQPHNLVHNNIGGAMGDPDTAGLDPIFWLHHANIDRLWQVWLDSGRANPDGAQWKDFPFMFHDSDGKPAVMKVKQVESTTQLGYQYTPSYPTTVPTEAASRAVQPRDIVGASLRQSLLGGQMANFQLEMVPRKSRQARLRAMNSTDQQKKSILHIDNVTGSNVSSPIDVFIMSGNDNKPSEEHFAGSIGLFGLRQASKPSLEHDGSGLNFALDVSSVVDGLRQRPDWDEEKIIVRLVPQFSQNNKGDIKVGRTSLETELGD